MNSFVNLMDSHRWSEQDIMNRVRSVIAGQVPQARQEELQTIMLGHISGMRPATPEEMGEIGLVKELVEQGRLDAAAARADMALLESTLALEAAQARLAAPPVDAPAPADGDLPVDPAVQAAYEQDVAERAAAQAVVDTASPDALALATARMPAPVEIAEQEPVPEAKSDAVEPAAPDVPIA